MELLSPTSRGQVTIPKRIRDALRITQKTKLRVYCDGPRVVFEPVSAMDSVLEALENEAREKGYTRDDMDQEIQVVRDRLVKKLYGE